MTETDTSFTETEISFIEISGIFVAEEDNSWKDPAGYLLSLLARDNEDISLAVNGITISTDSTVVTGTYGSLTINKNGYFEYTLDNSNNSVDGLWSGRSLTETITVTYTIDGRVETRSFDITIYGREDITIFDGLSPWDSDLGKQTEISYSIQSENRFAKAGAGDDVMHGNDEVNVLRGRGGFDALYGHGGNDRLGDGGGGALIDGGEGNDLLLYRNPVVESVNVDLGDSIKWGYNRVTGEWESGTGEGYEYIRGSYQENHDDNGDGVFDRTSTTYNYIKNIENVLTISAGNNIISGDDNANTITAHHGYGDATSTLNGRGGDDILFGSSHHADVFSGGKGLDRLSSNGGVVADTYVLYQGEHLSGEINIDLVLYFAANDKIRIETTNGDEVTLETLKSAADIRWTNDSNYTAHSFDSNDAAINDTIIYDTKGTASETDDTVLMVLEDFNTALTIDNFDVVQETLPLVFTSDDKAASIKENSGANQVVYTAVAVPEVAGTQVTYAINGEDGHFFTIDENTGEVTLIADPNFEAKPYYRFIIKATIGEGDNRHDTNLEVTLPIIEVDESPVFTSGDKATTIEEASGAGQIVYTAEATPYVEGASVTYSINGDDGHFFTIDAATGEVTLIDNPDFERKPSYSFVVKATTGEGINREDANQEVTLHINDIDGPVFTSGNVVASIDENTGANQLVYTAVAVPDVAGDIVKYSINGDDGHLFTIDENTGEVRLVADPNFEVKSSYDFIIKAYTGEGEDYQDVNMILSLTINDVNEAPEIEVTGSQRTLNEGTLTGNLDTGYRVTVSDPDGDSALLIVSDSRFEITNAGVLQAKQNAVFDFEASAIIPLTITTTDAGGLTTTETINIDITNVNENPTDLTLSTTSRSLSEGVRSSRYKLADITVTDDALGANSLRVSDTSRFEIYNGDLYLKAGVSLNHESNSYHGVYVSVDGGGAGSNPPAQYFRLNITDIDISMPDEANYFANSSIASGTQVADFDAVRTSGYAPISYSLSGADASFFNVDSYGRVTTASELNREVTKVYQVTVTATLGNGIHESVSQSLSVEVNKINSISRVDFALNVGQSHTYILDPDRNDGDTLTFTGRVVNAVDQGSISFTNGNRGFVYTPNAGYWGTDSFTLQVRDEHGLETNVGFTANINPIACEGHTLRKGTHGADSIVGSSGQDHFYGGRGNDVMRGNAGRDKYTIERNNGYDTIYDSGSNNIIEFKGININQIQTDIYQGVLVIGISNTALNTIHITQPYYHMSNSGVIPTDNRVNIENWNNQFDFKVGNVNYLGNYFAQIFDINYNYYSSPGGSYYYPVVLDLDDDGLEFIHEVKVAFDVNEDGIADKTSWVRPDDGILVYDKNSDNQVNGIDEISFLSYLDGAKTDLQALAAFDTNTDGQLSASDTEFAKFKIWRDLNSDGVSDEGELFTLPELGITSIGLTSEPDSAEQHHLVDLLGVGSYETADGESHLLGDVAFYYEAGVPETPEPVDTTMPELL